MLRRHERTKADAHINSPRQPIYAQARQVRSVGTKASAHRVTWQLDVDHQQRRYLLIRRQVRLVRHVWHRRQLYVLRNVTQLEIKGVQVRRYEPAQAGKQDGRTLDFIDLLWQPLTGGWVDEGVTH